jgi:hypothetical protein
MNKFYFTVLFLMLNAVAYSQSSINYDLGTSVDVGSGADVCADAININGIWTGSGTICSGPLPVTISSFLASVSSNNVLLKWVTEMELNNSGFDIERKNAKGNSVWQKINFVHGSGTTNERKNYSYADRKLLVGTYQYRLKQIDYNGNFNYYNLTDAVIITPPLSFSITQNYPNPSNPKSKIDFEIPINGKVSIKLYNITGQELTSLVNDVKEAGYYSVDFDGSNYASGVYFYRISAEGEGLKFNKTLKMVLVK